MADIKDNEMGSPLGAEKVASPAAGDDKITTLADHLTKNVEGYKQGDEEVVEVEENENPDPVNETPEEEEARLAKEKADAEKAEKDKEEVEAAETPEEKSKREAKEKADAEAEAKTKAENEKEPEPGKPVPYDRFMKVVEERNGTRQQLEQLKPVVDNYSNITNFCKTHSITPDQFEKAMRVQALLNTNPAEALKEILPLVEQLQGYVGDKLPADLQKEVDDEKISIERAKELASLRAKLQHGEGMQKLTAKQKEQAEAQRFNDECAREARTWEQTKRGSDPDYLPKKSESDPDGKWEDVRDKYLAMLNQTDARGQYVNPVNTPAAMVALMEKAYTAVNAKWSRITVRGKAATRKTLTASGQSGHVEKTKRVEDASSMSEAIQIQLANRR